MIDTDLETQLIRLLYESGEGNAEFIAKCEKELLISVRQPAKVLELTEEITENANTSQG